jgi:hypothetical protein
MGTCRVGLYINRNLLFDHKIGKKYTIIPPPVQCERTRLPFRSQSRWHRHTAQQHVHAADAQHRIIEVKAVEKLVMLCIGQHLGMPLLQRLAHRNSKAAGATSWITHDVHWLRCDRLDAALMKELILDCQKKKMVCAI